MNLLDREGKYNGDVIVSLQSKDNNSSIMSVLKRPKFVKSPAGIYIKSKDNKACVSRLNIKKAEMIDSRDDFKSCKITYDSSEITIVFMAG